MSDIEKSSDHGKSEASHVEYSDKHDRGLVGIDHRANDDRAEEAMGRNADTYEKNYWMSVNYIGTLFAIGMAFMGGIGGYGLIAPILSDINQDIGPDPNINWVNTSTCEILKCPD